MADYFVDLDGKIRKRKKQQAAYSVSENGKITKNILDNEDEQSEKVKPTVTRSSEKEDKEKKEKKWYDGYFQKSEGNALQTVAGSATDLFQNAGAGLMGMGESILDGLMTMQPYFTAGQNVQMGGNFDINEFNQSKANATDFIQKDLYDEQKVAQSLIGDNVKKLTGIDTDTMSVFGEKSDSLAQSVGQLGGQILLNAAGLPWFVTTGLSSGGSESENALNQGATLEQAFGSGLVSAGAEILSEKISGGIKFGGKTLDDAWVKPLTENISNSALRTLSKIGFDAAGEGAEEVVSQLFSNLGTALYRKEDLSEIMGSKEALEGYVESFIGGFVLGGGFSGIGAGTNKIQGKDHATGLTANEKKVVDSIANERIEEQEKGGKKLSLKEKSEIRSEIETEMDKGYLDIDKIESILGEDSYKSYKKNADTEARLEREIEAMKEAPNTIGNAETIQAMRDQLKSLKDSNVTKTSKDELFKKVQELTKNDRLAESYNEKCRRSKAFEVDLSQYDVKQQAVIKKAVDSGILNNTNRTHEFVDMIAKISADKGVSFDFTNNQKLKESGFALDGKTVNGYIQDNNISLNINSAKALNKVVGHEVTHVLEGTELYTELQNTIFEYAKSKGEYDTRLKDLESLYKDVEGADITNELTADLVGDYLFSDVDFVNKLSAEKPNIFTKIFDEIKYLVKTATAGSKEAKELLKVQRAFEKAYKENKIKENGTKPQYHVSVAFSEEIDKTLSGTLNKSSLVKARDYTPKVLVDYGIADLPMLITQNHVKSIIYTEKQAQEQGLKMDKKTHYHGLGKDLLVKAVDSLDSPLEIYKKSEDDFIIVTELQDKNGSKIIAPIRINGKGSYNNVYLDENHILSVYGKDNLDYYLKKNNFEKIFEKKGTTLNERDDFPNISDSSNNIISEDAENTTPTYSISEDSQGNVLSDETNNFFRYAQTRDENGRLKPFYHGTARGDRVGYYFDPNKATSGPMAYFTDNKEIGENYARDKNDTSLAYDSQYDSYETQFRVERNGKNMSVVELWDTLSASEKNVITEKAKHVTMDDDWENVIYSEETETGLGNFDSREMRAHRGNALHVLVDSWLTDGNIYGEEQKFLEVLRLVGISDAQYMNPNKREEKVYEVYLNVTNPLKTEEIDQQFVDELHEWLDETDLSVYQKETANADMWDKNSINPYDWLDKLQDDVNNGTTHAWTSIPDTITGYLKEKGYDGIFDIGGKGGGMGHQVVIPFYSNQIKEITNQSPTEESDDIRYSFSKDEDLAPVRTDIYGRDIALEAPVREDIAPVQGAAVEDMAPVRTDIGTPKTWDMSEEGMEEYIGSGNANDQYEPTPGSLDQKIKTVKDRNNAKLENYKVELKNKTKLRDEVHSAYNSEIAELQNSIERLDKLRVDAMASYNKSITELREEYEGKKNKDTKTANAILQKIERMKVSKREVDTDYDNQIYDLKGKIEDKKRHRDDSDANYEKAINDIKGRIDKMSTKEFKTAEQRMTKQQEHQMEMGELMGDTSTWVDKKMGISYKVNTLRRNLRDIVRDENGNRDIKKADAIYDALQGRYNHNEAALKREANKIKKVFADMDITKEEDAYIQMLGEYRHNPDTSLLADDMTEFFEKHKKNINEAKVDKIIEMSRELYDGLFQRLNEVLREQGMKEVEYRKGYFPHFTEDKQSRLAKLLNWKTKNNDIPTDIAGLTENFTPNRSWQSFNKHRTGDDTDYSFKKGLDTYVAGSLDWIYHIDDIQRRRAFENEVRYRHSDKGVQEKIEKIRSNEEYDADEMQEQIDMVYKEKQNPLNNFISDFRTGTNILAGKKNTMDRGMEEATNRHIYSTMTNISNRVTANMVVGSVSSALTNFIPITQSWGEVSPVTSLRAMRDTMHSFARDDGTVEKSDFLTNRLKPVENLYQSGWDKILDKAGLMMEIADDITAQTVWRSKYLENMADGMSETEAIKSADQFSENVMAGRSRGNMPTIFDAKNPLIKIFTAFQLEVNNQYGYMFKDLPQDIKKKTLGNLTMAYGKMYVGAYVYNQLYSWMTGRDAAFDPIGIVEDVLRDFGVFGDDEEEDALDALLGLTDSIVEEMPFVGGFLGGGRVPISSALPYEGLYEAFKGTAEDIVEGNVKSLTKEWLKPVVYVALPGGGGQIKKTVEGLSMFSDDFPVAGSYTDSGNLRFQVPDDFPTRLQAAVFGQWASDEAQQYLDEGRTPLKADKVPIAKAVGGYDAYMEYKEYVKQLESDKDEDGNSVPGSKKAKVIDYLSGLDVDYGMKLIMFKNEYPKDDTYDEQIKEYLKSRTDITSKERKSILAELGFE